MISALKKDGTVHLRNYLMLSAEPGEWSAPPQMKHMQALGGRVIQEDYARGKR